MSQRAIIDRLFMEVLADQEGTLEVELDDSLVLLESGLDSLGFAILVARLEEELGYDPFSLSEEPFYPRTYGEFVHFYAAHVPTP